MEYQIVTLDSKKIVGITAKTRNDDENIGKVIGGLWSDFFSQGIYQSIEDKKNNCTIGLYSDYKTDYTGEYSLTVGCEVNQAQNIPAGTVSKSIPKGKYAKFIVEGPMDTAVMEFWEKLWKIPLDRSYTGDFEEYQPENTAEQAIIHIYIALKE